MITSAPMLLVASTALTVLFGGPARAFTAADTQTPMRITSEDPRWIALRGRIVPESTGVVRAALGREKRSRPVVLIDSPGGSIEPALAIGRLIRARALDVAVGRVEADRRTDDAQCASACVLVLAAGVGRSVGPDAAVGIHRFVDWSTYSRTWDVYRVFRRGIAGRTIVVGRALLSRRLLSRRDVMTELPSSAYTAVRSYLGDMGVSPSLVTMMLATPANRLHWMTPAELEATRIATDRARISAPGRS